MGTPHALTISHVEIEGFKSFRDKAVIGPLGSFTCVVGPNGCGKSVVGEAIAFALGGNRKMMRAGSMAGLLNQDLKAAGGRTAQVTLCMQLVPVQPSPAACNSSQQQQQQEQQQLLIRRTLRGDTTKTHIMQPGCRDWVAVSQTELQAVLAPYNIHTEVVDRYIVTQSRQAVNVGDPVGLVRHLELLTGTAEYEEQIRAKGQLLEQLAEQIDGTQQEIGRLECERESLAPHVAHWQHVQQVSKQLMIQEHQLLQDQLEHGQRLIATQQQLVADFEAANASAAQKLQTLQGKERELAGQHNKLLQQLQEAKKTEHTLQKKAEKLSASMAAAKVELSSATAAAKSQEAVERKLETKLSKLLAEEAALKEQVSAAHMSLKELQGNQQATEQQLSLAKTAAAAAAVGGNAEHCKQAGMSAVQQQLEDLAAELAVLQAARATAASDAVHAATALSGLRASHQAAAAAAAATSQQLQLAQHELQQAQSRYNSSAVSVQEAEQSWKQAHLKLRVLQGQLHDACAELQHCEQQLLLLQQHPSGRSVHGTPHDAAIQQLHQLSMAGKLPGSFHGRLSNIAALTDSEAGVAVNAALQEVCNLNSTLIVSNRGTASAVINHFRQCKVGTVQCKILSEVAASSTGTNDSRGPAGTGGQGRSLLEFVTADESAVPGLQALLQQLLGNWLLVNSRETAMQLLHLRRNLVTRAGEVFKADGEIVVALQSSNKAGARHDVQHGLSLQPTPINPASTDRPLALSQPASAKSAAANAVTTAKQQLQELQEQAAAAEQEAATSDIALQQAQQLLHQHKNALSSAEAAEQRARSKQQAESIRTDRLLPGMTQQLRAAQTTLQEAESNLAAAAAAVDAAEREHKQLQYQLWADEHGTSKNSRCMRGDGVTDEDDSSHHSALIAAEQQLQQASAAVKSAWAEADAAKQQQKRVSRQLSATQKELTKIRGSSAGKQNMDKRQAGLVGLEQQLAAARTALGAAEACRRELSGSLKPAKQQLAAVGKDKGSAEEACTAGKARLQQQQSSLLHLQQQQDQWQATLEQLLQKLRDSGIKTEARQKDALSDTEMTDVGKEGETERIHVIQQQQQQQEQQGKEQQHQQMLHQEQSGKVATLRQEASCDDGGGDDGDYDGDDDLDGPVSLARQPRQGSSSRQQHKRPTRSRSLQLRGRRSAVIDSSSSSGEEADRSGNSSGSDEDGEMPAQHQWQQKRQRRVPQNTNSNSNGKHALSSNGKRQQGSDTAQQARRRRRQQQQQQQAAAARLLDKRGHELQQRAEQLAEHQEELAMLQAEVNEAAVDRDLKALQALAAAQQLLQQLEQQHDQGVGAREQLLNDRYCKLLAVLQALNQQLDLVYRQLTGGSGSAYCAYTQERRLLFSQGVTLHVQPDGNTWRQFRMLSGGQQALATLALSFALQVDCALDSSAAARVAAYVKAQCQQLQQPQQQMVAWQSSTTQQAVGDDAGCCPEQATAHTTQQTDGGLHKISHHAVLQHTTVVTQSAATSTVSGGAADTFGSLPRSSSAAGAQYLLVSHRPVVFESAGCLLGVYSNGRGSSAAVVGHFSAPNSSGGD